ncbi:MAG TPA: hypothetical protein DEQ28_01835 [Clostridiales bacterium]|nr:hypothetical protein [Clostridiales bacterium]
MAVSMEVPIDAIKVGVRLRQDMGDVAELAESIGRYGLLHPIVIDDENNLVTGARRLLACRSLGWTTTQAKRLGSLSEAERREIELEENLRRKDLTPYERSRCRVEQADVAARILRSQAETEREADFRSESDRKSERGRPAKPDAAERVAERIGISKGGLIQAEQHVSLADHYPFMQRPDWKQYHVMEAGEYLDDLSEEDRAVVVSLASMPYTPPRDAIKFFRRMAALSPEERAEIRKLYASDDSRIRAMAEAVLCDLPPEPEPRVLAILSAVRELTRFCLEAFPDDPFTPEIADIVRRLEALAEEIRKVHSQRVAHELFAKVTRQPARLHMLPGGPDRDQN